MFKVFVVVLSLFGFTAPVIDQTNVSSESRQEIEEDSFWGCKEDSSGEQCDPVDD